MSRSVSIDQEVGRQLRAAAIAEIESLPPFEQRAEELLSRVFGGMHHVHSLKKSERYWTCIHAGDLATFDFDTLTRLVLAAHEYCLRVSIDNGGPRALKIWVHNRKSRTGHMYERHPDLNEALERWTGPKK